MLENLEAFAYRVLADGILRGAIGEAAEDPQEIRLDPQYQHPHLQLDH